MGLQISRPLLSHEALHRYKRDGFICLRGILTPEELDSLRKGVSKRSLGHNGQNTLRDDKTTDIVSYGHAPCLSDEIKSVATKSALPAIVTGLMETEYTNFWEATTFVKTPGTSHCTAFHQDSSDVQIDGDKSCTVWVALEPLGKQNDAMDYIRGSHKWDQTYASDMLIAQCNNPTSPCGKTPDIEGNREDYEIVSFDVQPGDVIIHHFMTMYRSGGDSASDKSSPTISFRYCGDDIRYFDKPDAIDQPYIKNPLKNGDRLNSEDYPLVWGQLPT